MPWHRTESRFVVLLPSLHRSFSHLSFTTFVLNQSRIFLVSSFQSTGQSSQFYKSAMNINSVLPPETLLSTFNRLDSGQVVKARAVCKHWSEVINDTQSLWKVFRLEATLEQVLAGIDYFDGRNGSTLEQVFIDIKGVENEADEDIHTISLEPTLQKSVSTPAVLEITIFACLLGAVMSLESNNHNKPP